MATFGPAEALTIVYALVAVLLTVLIGILIFYVIPILRTMRGMTEIAHRQLTLLEGEIQALRRGALWVFSLGSIFEIIHTWLKKGSPKQGSANSGE